MYSIVVCIPTFQRQLLLKNLILSISKNNICGSLIKDISIIVCDNDVQRSAELTVRELKAELENKFKVFYFNFPIKGLSNVRNELFKQALKLHPDYIVCIDDDEYTTSEWLNQLLKTITKNNCEIVIGPVIPIFESDLRPYISHLFSNRVVRDNMRTYFFATGNFMICAKFLSEHKLKFDSRFNSTGGEDTYFGLTALKCGAKIYGSEKAIAFEIFSGKRATLKWILKRRYRSATNYTYILILEKKYFQLIKKSIVNVIYLLYGLIGLIFIIFPFKYRYNGILRLSESLGGFAGLFNIKLHEYK